MITVERDSARRGYEMFIAPLNKQWFISDVRIANNKCLKIFIKALVLPSVIYWRLWRATHKKQIAENKKRSDEYFKNNFTQTAANVWTRKV